MEHGEAGLPVARILSTPRVLVALLTCTVGAYSIGTIEATLSPYLQLLDLNVKEIAVAFLVMSLCSVLATPLVGWLCDAALSPWLVSSTGCCLMFLCYCFLGPVPYLAFYKPTFATVCASLVAQGFGSSAVLVASFGSAQRSAVESGIPESLEVQAVVSGLFTSAFALGNFFGPTVSGVMYDTIGFDWNCLVLQAVAVAVLLLSLFCLLVPAAGPQYHHLSGQGQTQKIIELCNAMLPSGNNFFLCGEQTFSDLHPGQRRAGAKPAGPTQLRVPRAAGRRYPHQTHPCPPTFQTQKVFYLPQCIREFRGFLTRLPGHIILLPIV